MILHPSLTKHSSLQFQSTNELEIRKNGSDTRTQNGPLSEGSPKIVQNSVPILQNRALLGFIINNNKQADTNINRTDPFTDCSCGPSDRVWSEFL